MGRTRCGRAALIAPWSVVWVDFSPQVGREQAGRRPAVVVGSPLGAKIHAAAGLVTVVPCTTRDRKFAWHVPVVLDRPSWAMCEQLKAVSVARVAGTVRAELADDEVTAVRTLLRRLLGL